MILEKKPRGKGLTIWTFQCDNHDCKKVFNREASRARAKHYCCHPCTRGVATGICKVEDCDEPIIKSDNNPKSDSGLCGRHHKNAGAVLKRRALRQEMFEMMGNKCVCCGEKNSIYFQVDHIENDADYKGVNRPSIQLQDYLKEPDRYQLLCANCNYAKRMNKGELYIPDKFTQRKPLAA